MCTVFLPAGSTPEALASVNVHRAVAGNRDLLRASQTRTNPAACFHLHDARIHPLAEL